MRRTVFPLVFVALTVSAATRSRSARAAAVNLAPNPGFEVADGGQPAFWAQRTPTDETRTLGWDSAVRRYGKRSVRILSRAPAISRWRTGHLRDLALEAGSEGVLAGWIRTKDVQGDAYLKLYCMKASGGIASQPQSTSVAGTRDWTEVRLPFQVPSGTGYVMIYLELKGTGTAWYDDVVLSGTRGRPSVRMALPPLTCTAADFECLEGYAWGQRGGRPVIELSPKARRGRAQVVFWGESARYDAAVTYVDERDGASSLSMRLNGKLVAQWSFGTTATAAKVEDVFREKHIRGLDIQRLSRITFEGEADGEEYCRIHKITFTAAGRFQGAFLPREKLPRPQTLRLHDEPQERRRARSMLARFVGAGVARVAAGRARELARLKSPQQWRQRQKRTRARLPEFLGRFGPTCPLNARIVGRLDRPDYVIEKLIFESQPRYYCTANVYVPKRRKFPQPGVLFTCGHAAQGKACPLYHEACLGFVLKGYVVLALDPTGQGERAEYFDPQTARHVVPLCVSHHHYLSRPSWLVGRSLAGYRVWDCVRALDYLVARPEVDAQRVAAVGNSGGGIMALLITAADERITACAAAHPGGSMEQTFLTGQRLTEADILSLIPPRPCLIIVGKDSGEEAGHRRKLNDMLPFYEGLGVAKDRGQLVVVHGVHDMKKPKREAAYAWVNRWFGKEHEGGQEPPLRPEAARDLNCTKTGWVVRDLGGETGQTLNAKVADRLRPPRPVPKAGSSLGALRASLRNRIAKRIGLSVPEPRAAPAVVARGTFDGKSFTAEKLLLESEPGIHLPALLLVPKKASRRVVVLHASELGKPTRAGGPSLALEVARHGHVVFSIDVRGVGETDPRTRSTLRPLTHYDAQQFRFDSLAVRAAQLDTTMLAMRAGDVIRAMDYLSSRDDLAGRPLVLLGEGLGGLWVLVAAAFDARPAGVVCVRTVPSYQLIVRSRYYKTRDYFWVNGALKDFDVPDLVGLAAPRPVVLLDPVDAMLRPLAQEQCRGICAWPQGVYRALGAPEQFRVSHTSKGNIAQTAAEVAAALARVSTTARSQ